jgi:hypothetical protein
MGDELKIVAKVYSSLGGLSKTLGRDGCFVSESDLKDFARGFTQSGAFFDYVDIGQEAKFTSWKIQGAMTKGSDGASLCKAGSDNTLECARWNSRNYNCKQIILGVPYDAHYAQFLQETFQNDKDQRRIMIIEGPFTAEKLRTSDFKTLDLPEKLFQDRNLQDVASQHQATAAPSPISSTRLPNSIPVALPLKPVKPVKLVSYAGAVSTAPPPPKVALPLTSRSGNITGRTGGSKIAAEWTPGPRGLDPPLSVDKAALDSIRQRKENRRLCNQYYIRGICERSDCSFEHEYKASQEEIQAVAFLTRLLPCKDGQDCKEKDCIFGHHVRATAQYVL